MRCASCGKEIREGALVVPVMQWYPEGRVVASSRRNPNRAAHLGCVATPEPEKLIEILDKTRDRLKKRNATLEVSLSGGAQYARPKALKLDDYEVGMTVRDTEDYLIGVVSEIRPESMYPLVVKLTDGAVGQYSLGDVEPWSDRSALPTDAVEPPKKPGKTPTSEYTPGSRVSTWNNLTGTVVELKPSTDGRPIVVALDGEPDLADFWHHELELISSPTVRPSQPAETGPKTYQDLLNMGYTRAQAERMLAPHQAEPKWAPGEAGESRFTPGTRVRDNKTWVMGEVIEIKLLPSQRPIIVKLDNEVGLTDYWDYELQLLGEPSLPTTTDGPGYWVQDITPSIRRRFYRHGIVELEVKSGNPPEPWRVVFVERWFSPDGDPNPTHPAQVDNTVDVRWISSNKPRSAD
jgi:hypothetical protein